MMESTAAFREFIHGICGTDPGPIDADGKWHRFRIGETRNSSSKPGGYLFHADGKPNGIFMDMRGQGERHRWKAEGPVERISPADARHRREQRLKDKEAEREASAKARSDMATYYRSHARETAAEEHPYLAKKKVGAHGVRVGPAHPFYPLSGECLLIPIFGDEGRGQTMQAIAADGQRRYWAGLPTGGGYHPFGTFDGDDPIVLAEGYSTAASIYEATGWPVVMALDSGNLVTMAHKLTKKHAGRRIVVAGDDDWHLPQRTPPLKNAGRVSAEAAAKVVDGIAVFPEMAGLVTDGGDDFNDQACEYGLGDVARTLRAAVESRWPIPAAHSDTPEPSSSHADDQQHDVGGWQSGPPAYMDEDIEEFYGAAKARARARGDEPLPPAKAEKGGKRGGADELPTSGVNLGDFRAFLPGHAYIFIPTRELWPQTSVNNRLGKVMLRDERGAPVFEDGKPKMVTAAYWLDRERSVEQMTWAPGFPTIIPDRIVSEGGWIHRPDVSVFNLYRPPITEPGEASKAGKWVDHVRAIYPDDAEHIINWLAQRVQHPEVKINHAIVLGGAQGIGKDTLLEPVKYAIGPWNFHEVGPTDLLGSFNGFVKSVILRVSEARDVGGEDRFTLYDHMKTYTAAPPDVLRVNEKHIREYAVFNVCGLIITTNHKTDGIFLPADDRRHYVAWSDATRDTFPADFWQDMYRWFVEGGGFRHVAAFLRARDLSGWNPKAPPPKTDAFWAIVHSSQVPESAELADAIEKLDHPDALTVPNVCRVVSDEFRNFLTSRTNSRKIPHRFEECGYDAIRNPDAKEGMWKVGSVRLVIYAKATLTTQQRLIAAQRVVEAARVWTHRSGP